VMEVLGGTLPCPGSPLPRQMASLNDQSRSQLEARRSYRGALTTSATTQSQSMTSVGTLRYELYNMDI
jgi:hypothetical protein